MKENDYKLGKYIYYRSGLRENRLKSLLLLSLLRYTEHTEELSKVELKKFSSFLENRVFL